MFSEAEAYERFMGRWSRRLATPFLKFAGLKDGDRVLDVGSGTGALALAVLQEAPASRVVGIDPSPAYVAHAQTRAGGGHATFEEGDAQRLRFPDGSFDATLALLVVNFIPDRVAAVREMARVTRSGGVVAAAVWDYGDRMEMLRAFWDEAVVLDPASEPKDERHMPACRPGELAALWTVAGPARRPGGAARYPADILLVRGLLVPFPRGAGPSRRPCRGPFRGVSSGSRTTACAGGYSGRAGTARSR